MTWAALFERAPDGIPVEDVREALADHRGDGAGEPSRDESPPGESSE